MIVNAWPKIYKDVKFKRVNSTVPLVISSISLYRGYSKDCKWYLPKNNRLTNRANITIAQLPNKNIMTKSAVCPLNEFSSNIRQYRYVNIMLKKKLNPNVPKNKNVVKILHTWNMIRNCHEHSLWTLLFEKNIICIGGNSKWMFHL